MVNKKTAVIGDPIDHSLSPKIHNHWIESEKIDVGTYQKINVKKENFIRDVDRLICLLYTSPSPRDNTTSRMPSSA